MAARFTALLHSNTHISPHKTVAALSRLLATAFWVKSRAQRVFISNLRFAARIHNRFKRCSMKFGQQDTLSKRPIYPTICRLTYVTKYNILALKIQSRIFIVVFCFRIHVLIAFCFVPHLCSFFIISSLPLALCACDYAWVCVCMRAADVRKFQFLFTSFALLSFKVFWRVCLCLHSFSMLTLNADYSFSILLCILA